MESTLKHFQADNKQLNDKIVHLKNVLDGHEQRNRNYCLLT